ncbi:hypothetical protein JX266_009842 [Neoarthrinium moseri]|nr:hypothetical protein JX266_009842 [Neoarthrinium moseri]
MNTSNSSHSTSLATLPGWLDSNLPHAGNGTFKDGLQCYSLPYGWIGFASDILTYWTFFWLAKARSPWWPSRHLDTYWWDFLLGGVSLLATLGLTIYAIVRCQSNWHLVLVAIWKMFFGLTMTCFTVHRAANTRDVNRKREERREQQDIELRRLRQEAQKNALMSPLTRTWLRVQRKGPHINDLLKIPSPLRPRTSADYGRSALLWVIMYALSAIPGLIGLIGVAISNWEEPTKAMLIICEVFGICSALCLIMALADVTHRFLKGSWRRIGDIQVWIIVPCMLAILLSSWSDFFFAAISVRDGGSWSGVPSKQNAVVYWGYFIFKRLPLLAA